MKSWANLVPWASSLAALLIGTMVPAADAANAANESVAARDVQALDHYHNVISPILKAHCYECHGDGARKAGLAFDALLTKDQILHDPQLWLKVLRNTRSRVMPPPGEAQPSTAELQALELWIKTSGFGLDPQQARSGPGYDPPTQPDGVPQHVA
jgi:mono/diheme cytochrome c family protein